MATQDAHSRSGLDEGEQVKLIAIARNVTAELLFNPIVDLVHPEKYMSYASYESINLRRLARMLPKSVWVALKRRLPLKRGTGMSEGQDGQRRFST